MFIIGRKIFLSSFWQCKTCCRCEKVPRSTSCPVSLTGTFSTNREPYPNDSPIPQSAISCFPSSRLILSARLSPLWILMSAGSVEIASQIFCKSECSTPWRDRSVTIPAPLPVKLQNEKFYAESLRDLIFSPGQGESTQGVKSSSVIVFSFFSASSRILSYSSSTFSISSFVTTPAFFNFSE